MGKAGNPDGADCARIGTSGTRGAFHLPPKQHWMIAKKSAINASNCQHSCRKETIVKIPLYYNDLTDIVMSFAEAALDSRKWLPAMELLGNRLGDVCCALELTDLRTGMTSMECSVDLGTQHLKLYEERIFHINPRVRAAMRLTVGTVADDRVLMDPEDPHSPEFLDWLEKTPYFYMTGGKVLDQDDQIGFFTCQYAKARGFPSEQDLRIHELLSPHLINVVEMSRALGARSVLDTTLAEHGLEASQCFLLLGANGDVLQCSSGMESLLRRTSLLTVRNRRLTALAASHRKAVDQLAAAVLSPERRLEAPSVLRLSGPHAPVGLVLRAIPVSPTSHPFDVFMPKALITVIDLDAQHHASCEDLKHLFELTTREADIAGLIGQGLMPDAIGRRLSISTHTVREHLQRIYGKVGVSRQTELALIIQRVSLG